MLWLRLTSDQSSTSPKLRRSRRGPGAETRTIVSDPLGSPLGCCNEGISDVSSLDSEARLSAAKPGQAIEELLVSRILVLDGAMGSLLQNVGLEEADFRGERFADHPRDLKGDPEVLVLTLPDVIEDVHIRYLEAGADIVSTDTFSATSIAQTEFGLENIAYELNKARRCCYSTNRWARSIRSCVSRCNLS